MSVYVGVASDPWHPPRQRIERTTVSGFSAVWFHPVEPDDAKARSGLLKVFDAPDKHRVLKIRIDAPNAASYRRAEAGAKISERRGGRTRRTEAAGRRCAG